MKANISILKSHNSKRDT